MEGFFGVYVGVFWIAQWRSRGGVVGGWGREAAFAAGIAVVSAVGRCGSFGVSASCSSQGGDSGDVALDEGREDYVEERCWVWIAVCWVFAWSPVRGCGL